MAQGRTPRAHQPCAAFSMMELLVVIALVLLLSALAMPAVRSLAGGAGLASAAEELAAAVVLARQRATTFNRQTALRFWRDGANFRSYQIWEQQDSADPASWQPMERERRLPLGIVATNHSTFSSLLTRADAAGTTNGRFYADALFTPSGSLVAEPDKTCVTLVPERGPTGSGVVPGLPPNFATVVIEPFNGIPRIYRP